MAKFNPDFWEVQTDNVYLEGLPQSASLWFDTPEGHQRTEVFQDFFATAWPVVRELIETKLTGRQRESVLLFFVYGKTQEEIAEILRINQSTVSRHIYGTVRNGSRVGGAIPKLRKLVGKNAPEEIQNALTTLQQKLDQVEKHDALAV